MESPIATSRNGEALASWEHYQATGLHVPGQEVIAWLETWGTDHECDPPLCRSHRNWI